jgi:hypothetical protein
MEFRVRVQCPCGGYDCQKIKTDSTTHNHFTDHEVTYRCMDCGRAFTIGVVKK